MMDSKVMADKIVNIIDDRKGKRIEQIEIKDITVVTDYFVIASGTSTTHVRGIADEVQFKMEQEGVKCAHIEGYETASWILLDFLDVVVHIFLEEERQFYNIERLWRNGGSYRPKPQEPEGENKQSDDNE
jgi:ribosome-associated protein